MAGNCGDFRVDGTAMRGERGTVGWTMRDPSFCGFGPNRDIRGGVFEPVLALPIIHGGE
jgi:hypothetical protein